MFAISSFKCHVCLTFMTKVIQTLQISHSLGGNVETPLNLIYCHQFFLLFLLKCAEEPWKGTLYSLIFFVQHQTLAPSFAIVQTGSGLGLKILDIFLLETARVNGTDISESLRPTVTKKNILLVKVEFLRFLTRIEPQEGKVNQTQFSLSLFSF